MPTSAAQSAAQLIGEPRVGATRVAVSRTALLAWFTVVCAVTLGAYARSFTVPFQFDDYSHIVNNAALREGFDGEFIKFGRTRIIPFTTLALNYWVGGEDTFGYHVVNLIVHLLATAAVLCLALELCRTPRLRGTQVAALRVPFAISAAFLFACHPIQVQAVTYIVQRISAIAALFYVGAIVCYLRARNTELERTQGGGATGWYAATGLCALAALLSKENAASLPLALALTEWVFYPGSASRRSLRRIAMIASMIVLIPLSWWLLPRVFRSQHSQPTDVTEPQTQEQPGENGANERRTELNDVYSSIRSMLVRAEGTERATPLQYLMTQCIVVPRYLRMVFAPYGFNVDHDVRIATHLDRSVLLGGLALLALLVVGIFSRSRWPVLSYGILWTFVALSVESTILPINDTMVEHRMYLAMPGLAVAVAAGFVLLRERRPVVTTLVGLIVIAALAAVTFERNEVWQTPLALWGDSVEKAPDKARPHVNLATALHRSGRIDPAIAHYCWALRLDPKNQQAKSNLNALVDQQIDKQVGSGKEIVLDGVMGADGTVELQPRDPCQGR